MLALHDARAIADNVVFIPSHFGAAAQPALARSHVWALARSVQHAAASLQGWLAQVRTLPGPPPPPRRAL